MLRHNEVSTCGFETLKTSSAAARFETRSPDCGTPAAVPRRNLHGKCGGIERKDRGEAHRSLMRSFAELAFRARQEAANLWLLAAPPKFSGELPSLPLPDPTEALRGSAYAAGVEQIVRQILEHKFPLLGVTVETGPEIRWRRDYAHGVESDLRYFRRIPYLNVGAVGDHKFI